MASHALHKALLAFALISATSLAASAASAALPRPQGPCDLYAAASTPCVAAHSTTRALYAAYNGPLYQIKRESDGRTLDIGIVRPSGSDAGGYANAAAQDAFCANTICVINLIYDQSGKGNHLFQAAPGTFKGPAKGAFDTQPIADMASISIGGHKAYGVYIIPGMGFRNNNASGLAIGDEPEGIYYVIDGTHYDSGCCFDYGNSSTNGRAVGTGTMETTYFGNSSVWGSGSGTGPWIMSDMEAGLFSGHGAKQNLTDPAIDSWRFVTAVVDGGGGNRWDLRGGNAQQGALKTFYSGERPGLPTGGAYFPMHKQGGILLGTGGDNGNGSSGTFYEGVMTTGYPSEATTDAVQANVVAARYNVQPVALSRVAAFTPGSSQQVTETFTNVTNALAPRIRLSLSAPGKLWKATISGSGQSSKAFTGSIAPGASVSATFTVTAPTHTAAGSLFATAAWKGAASGAMLTETATTRVRSVFPIKINEVSFGSSANPADQFIELYNASDRAVDISNWTVSGAQSQWAPTQLAKTPAATRLAAHNFYLLALASSGLAAPASSGATSILLRSTSGFEPGQTIDIDGESHTIASVGSSASPLSTIFIPVSTNPWLTLPAGSTHLPVTSAAGFEAGQKIGIDIGGHYEVVTVKVVGKPGTQTTLTAAAAAGASSIRIAAATNITSGDSLTIGTGSRREIVKVAGAGAQIDLTSPLKFDHSRGIDVSDLGTGITFSPATRVSHTAGEAMQALGNGIALDHPLARSHPYGAPVNNPRAVADGYQGPPSPNQWFGTPLSRAAGSIALKDASGSALIDAIVYGSQQSNSSGNGTITSPEIAVLVGSQDRGGCIVVASSAGPARGGGGGGGEVRSWGRYPDGAETGSLCADFHAQTASTIAAPSVSGATNIKIGSVDGFIVGQKIIIGSGTDQESAVIAAVGTPGATTLNAAVAAGATSLTAANAFGFRPGQAITIGEGGEQEMATIEATGRRGAPAITLAAPLKFAHAEGNQVAGTGITLTAPLVHTHATGEQITDNVPTPGAPNQYEEKSR